MNSETPLNDAARSQLGWLLSACLIVVMLGGLLRYGTQVLDHGNMFDEVYIKAPIDDLVHNGWTVEHALDFKETKGPTLIWSYAGIAEIVGSSLNDYRLISAFFFIAGVLPLLWIAQRCHVHGANLIIVAGLYALLPYNAVLGQLLMGEPTFVFGSLLLIAVFMWGFGDSSVNEKRLLGPLLFAIVLSIQLHNRVHAVAFAGAVVLLAFERDRMRSWPWWLACLLAGLSRLPLWYRWGGLVHPDYQHMHGLGFRMTSLTYLAAAMLLFTGVFLVAAIMHPAWKRNLRFIISGAVVGGIIGMIASPSLRIDLDASERFQGVIASAVLILSKSAGVHTIVLAGLASLGLASLGALAALSWPARTNASVSSDMIGLAGRLTVLTLLVGWSLYALTQGWVFDRYLLPWAILVPVLWSRHLPRWLMIVQALLMMLILAQHTSVWLVQGGPHG
ncbi:MAG: hypothetical protein ACR2GY_08300 [Phycisphaerales bacterium]